MLKSLRLYHFQAHRDLRIVFAPGITTIKGASDVGKSAVLRALRWLALNDIPGDDFISHGEEEAVVVLKFDDSKAVRRKGGENIYKLNGSVFKSFGAGKVPDQIAKALGLNEINFQKQHDSPFWFASSAPEVSRQLNRVIDLSVIDEAMASAGRLVRSARERVVVSEDRLEEKRAKFKELKSGTRRIEQFKLLRGKYEKREAVKKDHDQLEAIINMVDSCDVDALDRREKQASWIHERASQLLILESKCTDLRVLIERIDACHSAAVEVPDFAPVQNAWKRISRAESERIALAKLLLDIEETAETAEALETTAAIKFKKLARVACPTCGKKNEDQDQ